MAFVGLVPGLFIPKVVLRRVFEAERGRELTTQFQLTDLMWLTLIVQLGLTALRMVVGDVRDPSSMWLYGFVLVALPLSWWHCLKVLSRAGVFNLFKRGLFLVVVVPLTLIATVAGGIAGASLPFVATEIAFGYREASSIAVTLGVIVFTIIGVFILKRAANYCIDGFEETGPSPNECIH